METSQGIAGETEAGVLVRRRRLFLILAAVAYFAAGMWASVAFGTWTDEEYTLATTAHGLGYALSRAVDYELQAPLYFGILALWRGIDSSVWFARSFSVLCATAFIFVLAKIGSRVAPEFDPLPFAMLVALNPFVVMAALEIRLYALALLLSGLMWLAFDDGFVRGSSWRARAAFVALAICGVYVQYFLGFMLAGFFCTLLVLARWRALASYVACGAVVTVAAVPLALAARSQLGGYEGVVERPSQLLLAAANRFLTFPFPRDFVWKAAPLQRVSYWSSRLTLLAIVLSWPRITRALAALIASAAAIQLTFMAASLALAVPLNGRYYVALFVPVAAATYGLFRAVRLSARPWLSIAFVSIAVLTVLDLFSQYRFLAQPGDWKRVAPYLAEHAAPGDVIAIFPPDGLPAFARQYAGSVPVVPFPRPISTERYSLRDLSVASPDDARVAFAKLAQYRHVWFVDGASCPPDSPEYGCDNVEKALREGFVTLDRRAFYKNDVYELLALGKPKTQP